MSTPLTTQLLNISTCPLSKATTHPFLQQAGRGRIPKPVLSQWLSQDRLYAQAYIRFIGLLLSKIRPSPQNPGTATAEHRAVDVLIDALGNIRSELAFFETVAGEYGLDLTALPVGTETEGETEADAGAGAGTQAGTQAGASAGVEGCVQTAAKVEESYFAPNHITQAYLDLFMSAGGAGVSVLEGLVVLWATEVCYLQAWRYAASFGAVAAAGAAGAGAAASPEKDADGGALRVRFIPNWTSPEFEAFVRRIGDVVDELAGQIKGADEREALLGRCVQWWRHVLWLEERFWPVVKLD